LRKPYSAVTAKVHAIPVRYGRDWEAGGLPVTPKIPGSDGEEMERVTVSLACASEPRQLIALTGAHRVIGELNTEAGRHKDARTHLE
jgi:hypothetical protein